MKRKIVTLMTAILLLGLSVSNAGIVVLDFESLSTPGTGYTCIGLSYSEDSFNLEAVPSGELCYFHTEHESFAGSTALYHRALGGYPDTMLTHADGLPFDLLSLDISEPRPDWLSVGVSLIGTKSDNSTVTSSFTLDGVFGFEMHTLETFTDLIELRLVGQSYQYDNITFDVIPEPTTIVLFGLGVLLLRKQT